MTPTDWAWRRWIGLGIFALLILLGVAAILATLLRVPMVAPGTFPGMGWVWGFFGFIFFLWILMWFVRFAMWPWWRTQPWRWHSHRDEASEILRVRYARGEITKDQFEAMLQDLDKDRSAAEPWERR